MPDTHAVPFGDIGALEQKLVTRKIAAFIVEPIQSEAGIRIPPASYLAEAQALCERYGTLFVLDEVQTGMFRTGAFLAAHHYGVEPDMVILAKALSGGLIPAGALLMTDAVYESVYDSLKRAIVHTSTFSENSLAMRAGLATLDVLEGGRLGQRGLEAGERLRRRLRGELCGYEMVQEIRGQGMLSGISFQPPRSLRLRVSFEAFQRIHPGLFGQVVVMRMFRDKDTLTQICGNNFMVLKAAPPLTVSEAELDRFVIAVREVMEEIHSSSGFWTEALGMARRAVNI